GVAILGPRYRAERFLAYFQAATNTHAPVEKLRRLYDEALAHPQVVGLAVGTRPDAVPDPVLDLLEEYARDRFVCLELGLQSRHDRSLDWMNRGHHYDAFVDAAARCGGRGLDLCAHVILGLPGEGRDKPSLRGAVGAELTRRDSWQGRHCRGPAGEGPPPTGRGRRGLPLVTAEGQ